MEFTKLNGLNVTIVTSAKTDHEARLLLSGFQAPFVPMVLDPPYGPQSERTRQRDVA